MFRRSRSFVAALAATAVLLGSAAPALAYTDEGLAATRKGTPWVLDAMVLRPVGLLLTIGGAVAFVPAGAIDGQQQKTDIGKPFEQLVANPFRYTFVDPLGEHDQR